MFLRSICLSLLLLPGALWAQNQASAGFQLQPLPTPVVGLTAAFDSGDFLSFDGRYVQRWTASGALLADLYDLGSYTFSSFVRIAPDQSFALVGESSNGGIYRVDLLNGGGSPLAQLTFNFDLVFESNASAIVSAATCGFSCGNDLVRLDTSTGATTFLAKLAGPSGPLALDGQGNLYYATQDTNFPAAPASTDVLLFLATSLTGSPLLTQADGLLIAPGFDGASSLAFDAQAQALYLAENNFGSGLSRVLSVVGSQQGSTVLANGASFGSISNLEVRAASGGAALLPYQPASGGGLSFQSTDYFSYALREVLVPKRSSSSFSGPGTLGVGNVLWTVQDAEPSGFVFALFAPAVPPSAPELFYNFPGLNTPIFTSLPLAALQFLPMPLACDPNGSASLAFFNPGNLQGVISAQGLICNSAFEILGTTTVSTF